MISKKYKSNADSLTKIPSPLQTEPKYIFIGFFVHGEYNESARPHKVHPHAAETFQVLESTPTLMTFMNCTPGNVLIGEAGGGDNTRLTNYFKTNSGINLMTVPEDQDQDQDQVIAENFLTYAKDGLATLQTNPRDKIEKYKTKNKTDIDVCRNSYICNNQVGISHTFINKTYTTQYPELGIPPEDWGIFIYNNNCGIEPGTNIESILGMPKHYVKNKNDDGHGYDFYLSGIVSTLQNRYKLTDKDYLFLFDYTCSKFTRTVIDPDDKRGTRGHGNNVAKALGFIPTKTGKKRERGGGKRLKGGNKKTKKNGRRC
jgi:hypothetical protein